MIAQRGLLVRALLFVRCCLPAPCLLVVRVSLFPREFNGAGSCKLINGAGSCKFLRRRTLTHFEEGIREEPK
jgi:hypothetical protein